jgi:hypothetical protein
MALTYDQKFALTRSQLFRDKVAYSLLLEARAIKTATMPDPKPADWDRKQDWAHEVLGGNVLRWVDVAINHVLIVDAVADAGESADDTKVRNKIQASLSEIMTYQVR